MKFQPLFRVRVRHEYYSDSVCRDLSFEPTAQTQRLLARYRLLLKEQPDGLAVWMATDADGKTALISPPLGEKFVFHLIVRNPDFALFTDLHTFEGKTDPVFSNTGTDVRTLELHDRESWKTETLVIPAGTAEISFTLTENPLALNGDALKVPQAGDFSIVQIQSEAKIAAYNAPAKAVTIQTPKNNHDTNILLRYRIKSTRDKKILASVELHYNTSVPAIGTNDAPFEVKLKARTSHWAYYLISDQIGEFSMVDSNKILAFSKADMAQASDEDPMVATLSEQYPKPTFQQVRFLSEKSVPCSSATHSGIELQLGGVKIFGAMPNPSIHQISSIKQKVETEGQDQDTLHQVVKHLKAH